MNAQFIKAMRNFAHSVHPSIVEYLLASSMVYLKAGTNPLNSLPASVAQRAVLRAICPTICAPFVSTCVVTENLPEYVSFTTLIGERVLSSGRTASEYTAFLFLPQKSKAIGYQFTEASDPRTHNGTYVSNGVPMFPVTIDVSVIYDGGLDMRSAFDVHDAINHGRLNPSQAKDLHNVQTLCLDCSRDFEIAIAAFLLPCFYCVRVTSEEHHKGKARVLNGFSIYRCLTPNRLHRVYQGVKDAVYEVPPHPRRGHMRYHWARSGIDRHQLPSDMHERLELIERKRVTWSFVRATWVGDQSFRVDNLRYEVGQSLCPNASPTFDNRLVSVDEEFTAVASDYEAAQEADLDERCAEAMSYGGAEVLA